MILLRRIVFSLVSVTSIAAATYFSFFVIEPNYAMTGIWLTFSLFVFALGWPEIAKSISFLGNRLELREIETTIRELRQLAEVNISALLEILQTQMRFGGVPEEKKQEILRSTESVLKNIGFKSEEIKNIQSRYHYWVKFDYVRAIIRAHNIKHPVIPKDRETEWNKKREEIIANSESYSPDDLRKVFTDFSALTEPVKSKVDAYEYYVKNHKHRDLEEWNNHHNWFEK